MLVWCFIKILIASDLASPSVGDDNVKKDKTDIDVKRQYIPKVFSIANKEQKKALCRTLWTD